MSINRSNQPLVYTPRKVAVGNQKPLYYLLGLVLYTRGFQEHGHLLAWTKMQPLAICDTKHHV